VNTNRMANRPALNHLGTKPIAYPFRFDKLKL
jgi:hypothetical protein